MTGWGARWLSAWVRSGRPVNVHGRNPQRGADVISEIQAGTRGDAAFYPADFASLDEVRGLADTVLDRHGRLDLLVNNAGIFTDGIASRRTSADGPVVVFAVNYLAGFALTHRLLPLVTRSAPARVVHVASIAQQPLDLDDVMLTQGFSASRAYAQSEHAQVMHTFDLEGMIAGAEVSATCLHPATLMERRPWSLAPAWRPTAPWPRAQTPSYIWPFRRFLKVRPVYTLRGYTRVERTSKRTTPRSDPRAERGPDGGRVPHDGNSSGSVLDLPIITCDTATCRNRILLT